MPAIKSERERNPRFVSRLIRHTSSTKIESHDNFSQVWYTFPLSVWINEKQKWVFFYPSPNRVGSLKTFHFFALEKRFAMQQIFINTWQPFKIFCLIIQQLWVWQVVKADCHPNTLFTVIEYWRFRFFMLSSWEQKLSIF